MKMRNYKAYLVAKNVIGFFDIHKKNLPRKISLQKSKLDIFFVIFSAKEDFFLKKRCTCIRIWHFAHNILANKQLIILISSSPSGFPETNAVIIPVEVVMAKPYH